MMKRKILNCMPFALLLIPSSIMADSQLNFSVGYERTIGDYDQENTTEITSIPLTMQYMEDAWRLRVSVPFISVTGDGSVTPGINGAVKSDSDSLSSGSGSNSNVSAVETDSGLGDIMTSVSYALLPQTSAMFYEITTSVKWGTASAKKGLGSGENDYSVSLYSLYQKHKLKPFINVGYLFMGDTNVIDYNDVFFANPGLLYSVGPHTSFSFSYNYQQATTDITDESQSLSLYANQRLSKQWSGSAFIFAGLTDSVADTGLGLSLTHSF